MEKTDVKIGGRRLYSEIYKKASHWSPFAFGTLKEIPFPSWALPFTLLFFCLIWRGYERNYLPTSPIQDMLTAFVNTERSHNPKRPEILITGSSLNRCGIYVKVMENITKNRVASTTISGGTAWEMQRIMMRYHHFFNNTKIIIYNVSPSSLYQSSCHPRRLHLRRWGERKSIIDNQGKNISFVQSLLPTRYSIKTIYCDLQFNEPYENFFYTNRKPIASENKSYQKAVRDYATNYECDNIRIQELYEFIKYCTNQGMYVIVNVMPNDFAIPDSLPFPNTDDPGKRKFLVVLDELRLLPNCSVITMKDRNVIKHPNKIIFYDPFHMTNVGAEVYTNWLVDQMLKDQKIVTALKTPRKPEEFFAKKYTKKCYMKIANYFKKKTDTDVKVAQPQGNPVK
ncbi:MAG: hypothetical protein LBE13_13125 [Bacteroidales bacterium]|jgi:hypothetical protein|nr:hypothetical protein [Bacteroidales bacterium]